MLTKLVDWLVGCSYAGDPPTLPILALSILRCVVRFALVIALLYVLVHQGLDIQDAF